MSEKIKAVRGNARYPERVREWLEGQGASEFPAGSASKLNEENLLYFVKPDGRVSFIRKEYDYFVDVEELPRWRAKFDEEYWYIDDTIEVRCATEDSSRIHDARYVGRNYFQTEGEAEEYCSKIEKLLEER